MEEASRLIDEGNKILGLSEVTGPGVIITLSDSKTDSIDPVVHDMDILMIVNELKNAGAEAIAINGQRVVPTTAIICGGNIVMINGERIGAPFIIEAIGQPDTLANLSRPNGYLSILRQDYGIGVDLRKVTEMTLPRFNGVLNSRFMNSI